MIKISFEFCTMYDPGELAPPQFVIERRTLMTLPSTPRFKDQIIYDSKDYMVWDVKYNLDTPGDDMIYVKAVRKVTYPPKDDDSEQRGR